MEFDGDLNGLEWWIWKRKVDIVIGQWRRRNWEIFLDPWTLFLKLIKIKKEENKNKNKIIIKLRKRTYLIIK